MCRGGYRRAISALLMGIALVGAALVPSASASGAGRHMSIPFNPLDGGKPVLPDVLVTALTTMPDGTVYAGGHVMVKSTYAFANPPVVPAGSVWLVSHDHGAHWTRRVSTTSVAVVHQAATGALPWTDHHAWPTDFTANALAADPRHPSTIYAAGCTGTDALCLMTAGQHRLLRSADGGATWSDAIIFHTKSLLYTGLDNLTTNIGKTPALDAVLKQGPAQLPGQALDVAIDPANSRRVYACMSGIGVLRSDDGARTWRYSDTPQFGWENVQCDLLIDPRNTAVVYAVDRVNGRVYRSGNAGKTWALASDFGYRSNQRLYNPTLVNGVLYITGYNGIYASNDQGQHWRLTIPDPVPGAMAGGIHGNGGWIAAFSPAASALPTGVYGWRDGQPWRLLVDTDRFGTVSYSGSLDDQAMHGEGVRRMWEDHLRRIVFTSARAGGLYRWGSGL
jgi:hypothetical protein